MQEPGRTERHLDARISAVRHFNRFYTGWIGVLKKGMYGSALSLTQMRVLYELSQREKPTATELRKHLGLDAGYLSRIMRGFEKRGMVCKTASKADGRRSLLSLTREGYEALTPLNARADEDAGTMLNNLSGAQQRRLVAAMRTIEKLLSGQGARKGAGQARPQIRQAARL
jgi:DNA-binding MarR family transcriptional regulator